MDFIKTNFKVSLNLHYKANSIVTVKLHYSIIVINKHYFAITINFEEAINSDFRISFIVLKGLAKVAIIIVGTVIIVRWAIIFILQKVINHLVAIIQITVIRVVTVQITRIRVRVKVIATAIIEDSQYLVIAN